MPFCFRAESYKLQFPDIICGDFDSIRPEVLAYYRNKGSSVVQDEDPNATDLHKCLKQISQARNPNEPADVVIFGGLGGRHDQAFSLLNQLYVAINNKDKALRGIADLYLVTREGLIFLLEKGSSSILTPLSRGVFTPNIGIIPIGRPSIITTKGLEWDITDWATEFGGQVSTSNHIVADIVEVDTTERVLFTMEWVPAAQQTS